MNTRTTRGIKAAYQAGQIDSGQAVGLLILIDYTNQAAQLLVEGW